MIYSNKSGMNILKEPSLQALAQYAYEPIKVYLATVGMMVASGFGFPLPEEVTIISLGLLAYVGSHPELFPPPAAGAVPVSIWIAPIVCFIAVVLSDMLVFSLGRVVGRKILRWPPLATEMSGNVLRKIEDWSYRYGVGAVAIFRFTPGLRFPAHIILGLSKLEMWKFVAMDGMAALISVPTQILLVAFYGEVILKTMYKFKLGLLTVGGVLFTAFLVRKIWSWRARMRAPTPATPPREPVS
jgi:membrane protein DedA with SNARE-associated domain